MKVARCHGAELSDWPGLLLSFFGGCFAFLPHIFSALRVVSLSEQHHFPNYHACAHRPTGSVIMDRLRHSVSAWAAIASACRSASAWRFSPKSTPPDDSLKRLAASAQRTSTTITRSETGRRISFRLCIPRMASPGGVISSPGASS